MVTGEVIVLTSSPTRPQRLNTATMSSSPGFPSLLELTQSRPAPLRNGSRAAPVPHDAPVSFVSAAALLQTSAEQEGVVYISKEPVMPVISLGIDEPAKTVKPKVVRKPRATKTQEDSETMAAKKPRKPRAKKVTDSTFDNTEPKEKSLAKEKPVRKPRLKKSAVEGQTKLPNGKVTKASTSLEKSAEGKSMTDQKKTEKVSSHFTTVISDPGLPVDIPMDNDLMLPGAGKRKVNWTPPKDTLDESRVIVSGISCNLAASKQKDSNETQLGFSGLIEGWSYSNDAEAQATVRPADAAGTRKRKLVELVKTTFSTSAEPEVVLKCKATKKKPRTITDLATAAYRTTGQEDQDAASPAPLLQFFSYENGKAAIMESRTLEGFKVPSKPRNKSPTKSSSRPQKSKRPELPKLFSPHSALKQVEKQDFVFGTSSQLAREDSPTLLRDIQQAMLESNKLDSDPFYEILDTPITDRPQSCFIGENGAVIYPGKRNLWSAGAYGSSMNIEEVDMTETPKTLKTSVVRVLPAKISEIQMSSSATPLLDQDQWHRLDDTPVVSAQVGIQPRKEPTSFQLQQLENSPIGPSKLVGIPLTGLASNSTAKVKSPSKSKPASIESGAMSLKPGNKDAPAGRPDFGSYSTAQLSKEVASYRFKPIKNRDTMVSLLEKCWDGKQRMALGTLGVNRAMSTSPSKSPVNKADKPSTSVASPKRGRPRKGDSALESPKRPVGRPRKTVASLESPKRPVGRPRRNSSTKPSPVKVAIVHKKASGTDGTDFLSDSDTPLATQRRPRKQSRKPVSSSAIEEISDSDAPSTPSPPRRRPSKVGIPPKPLELSSNDSIMLSPTSQQLELHRHISKAITSAPPSTDPKAPSWHEKILLYDPIVLEELTTWLNTGALQKVGWDGEVEPKEVKAWCLGKSICCLWRENLRGGARSRY